MARLMLPNVWQMAESSRQEQAPARKTKTGQRGTSAEGGSASVSPCASAAAAEEAAPSRACSSATSFSRPPASSAARRAAASAAASDSLAEAPPAARAASVPYSSLRRGGEQRMSAEARAVERGGSEA